MIQVDNDICETQGDLFVYANQKGYDMLDFIEKYMRSDFCERHMDAEYSTYQYAFPVEFFSELMEEIHVKKGEPFEEGVLEWIGYFYRYIFLYLRQSGKPMSSKEIYNKWDAEMMFRLYAGYHTIDEEMAVCRLLEAL